MWDDVDFYCERTASGFGSEPLNTLSALAFLAVAIWRLRASGDGADVRAALALGLLSLSSVLHHSFALRLTLLADVWANVLFLALLLGLVFRRLGGLAGWGDVTGLAAALAIAIWPLPQVVPPLVGMRFDTFVVLACIMAVSGALAVKVARDRAVLLVSGAVVLGAGLPFRLMDGALCDALPIGTHFAWHLANAAATALFLWALSAERPVNTAPVRP